MTLQNVQTTENALTQPAWLFTHVVSSNLPATMPFASRWRNAVTVRYTVTMAVMRKTAENWFKDRDIRKNWLRCQKMAEISRSNFHWQSSTLNSANQRSHLLWKYLIHEFGTIGDWSTGIWKENLEFKWILFWPRNKIQFGFLMWYSKIWKVYPLTKILM